MQWDTDEDKFLEEYLPKAVKKEVKVSDYGEKIYDTIKKKITSKGK